MNTDKLERFLLNGYHWAVLFGFVFTIFIIFTFSNNTYSDKAGVESITMDKWDIYSETNEYIGSSTDSIRTDDNEVIILKASLPDDLPYDFCMGFYTSHMNVHVYCSDHLIYSFTKGDNAFGHSPGYGYHLISQLYQYAGETIEIHISSPYGISALPEISLAGADELFFLQLAESALPFALAIITFLFGLLILAYGIYTIVRANVNQSFIYLGLFTMTLGIYTVNEQTIFLFITNNHIFSSCLSFITLMLLPMPFILFLKELYTNKRHIIWYILLAIDLISICTVFLLQILNICDFKESLIITHLTFGIIIVTIFVFTVYELIKYKLTTSMKLNIVCIIIVAFFMSADMLLYYTTNGISPVFLGNFGFLIYIIVVGCHSIRANTTLIARGQQAEKYRTLAYRDNLTGIYNRTAHDNDLAQADTSTHKYLIGMFDLNDLKYYNDHLGHNVGDKYITTCADIIKESFYSLTKGRCYRIGGDEFCVILIDKDVDEYLKSIEKMNAAVNAFNETSDDLQIHIANGYAEFDLALDKNLKETRSRADAMMYKNKFMMKQQQNRLH